jgi:hypothetical protein
VRWTKRREKNREVAAIPVIELTLEIAAKKRRPPHVIATIIQGQVSLSHASALLLLSQSPFSFPLTPPESTNADRCPRRASFWALDEALGRPTCQRRFSTRATNSQQPYREKERPSKSSFGSSSNLEFAALHSQGPRYILPN